MEQRTTTAGEHSSTASGNSGLLQPASIAAWHQGTAAARPPDEDLYQPSEMIATAGRKQQANKASGNSSLKQPTSIAARHHEGQQPTTAWAHSSTASGNSGLLQQASIASRHQGTAN